MSLIKSTKESDLQDFRDVLWIESNPLDSSLKTSSVSHWFCDMTWGYGTYPYPRFHELEYSRYPEGPTSPKKSGAGLDSLQDLPA